MTQGSVLRPVLFNIFINDVFYAIEASEICNFANDNTIYALSHKVESMIAKLEIAFITHENGLIQIQW